MQELPLSENLWPDLWQVHHLTEVDSTNAWLLAKAKQESIHKQAILVDSQTQGRGRLGRTWISPPGNLYLSAGWSFPLDTPIQGLSLVVAYALILALKQLGYKEIQIKWPNDLQYQGKKLSGILIESLVSHEFACRQLIIGIGVNRFSYKEIGVINQAWSSLQTIKEPVPTQKDLTHAILQQLSDKLTEFSLEKLAPTLTAWPNYDALCNQSLCITQGDQQIEGLYQGLNAQGELRLETKTGESCFSVGEVSVRLR